MTKKLPLEDLDLKTWLLREFEHGPSGRKLVKAMRRYEANPDVVIEHIARFVKESADHRYMDETRWSIISTDTNDLPLAELCRHGVPLEMIWKIEEAFGIHYVGQLTGGPPLPFVCRRLERKKGSCTSPEVLERGLIGLKREQEKLRMMYIAKNEERAYQKGGK